MKILNRTEFMKLPAGVLYRKQSSHEHAFEEIQIKGDTYASDFACMTFGYCKSDDETDMWLDDRISRPVNVEYYGRDGCFEQEALFLVYETWDLEQLRKVIDYAITVAPKQQFKNPWDSEHE